MRWELKSSILISFSSWNSIQTLSIQFFSLFPSPKKGMARAKELNTSLNHECFLFLYYILRCLALGLWSFVLRCAYLDTFFVVSIWHLICSIEFHPVAAKNITNRICIDGKMVFMWFVKWKWRTCDAYFSIEIGYQLDNFVLLGWLWLTTIAKWNRTHKMKGKKRQTNPFICIPLLWKCFFFVFLSFLPLSYNHTNHIIWWSNW